MTENNTPTLARRSAAFAPRWRPFDELSDLRRQMDEVFTRMFGYTPLSRLIPEETVGFEPFVDIYETQDKVLVFASLPGYAPDAIHVEATNESVTLFGERKPLFEDEKAIAHRDAGLTGGSSFRCTYSLPVEVDPNKIKATFYHGVLELEMPKSERAITKTVNVKVVAAK